MDHDARNWKHMASAYGPLRTLQYENSCGNLVLTLSTLTRQVIHIKATFSERHSNHCQKSQSCRRIFSDVSKTQRKIPGRIFACSFHGRAACKRRVVLFVAWMKISSDTPAWQSIHWLRMTARAR